MNMMAVAARFAACSEMFGTPWEEITQIDEAATRTCWRPRRSVWIRPTAVNESGKMKVYKQVKRLVEIGEPDWSSVLLNYWSTDSRLKLHRTYGCCGKRYDFGSAWICHFKTEGNVLVCANCQPISKEDLEAAQKRYEQTKVKKWNALIHALSVVDTANW